MGSAWQEGGSEGRGLGLGAQQAPPVPKWTGKVLAEFSSVPLRRSPTISPRVFPHCCWTPNPGWVPLGVGTPPLPQPPMRGAGPRGPAFTFAPPSLPSTLSGPTWLEGASVGRDQAQDLSRFLGAHMGRGNLATLPFDPLPSQ